MQKGLK